MTSTDPAAAADWLAHKDPTAYDATLTGNLRLALDLGEGTGGEPGSRRTSWDFGAYVATGENEEVNRYARQEVAAGAEALLFRLYQQPGVEDIHALLDGLDLRSLSLHCSLRYPGQDPAELFRDLVKYLRRRRLPLNSISGSVDFDPLLDWSEPPFPPLIRLLYFVSRWMPEFCVLQVNAAGFNNGITEADTELALALAKGEAYLTQIRDRGYPVALANQHLKFAFTVGTSFYGDVAKLRAFRALWSKVLDGLAVDNPPLTQLAAHTDIMTMTGEATADRLNLHLQALAADFGGADLLFLAPAEGPRREASTQGRRQVRQVVRSFDQQDGLAANLELDKAYLDDLTVALVKAAWVRYRTIQDQGGFTEAVDF